MGLWGIVAIAVAVLIVGIWGWSMFARERSRRLRTHFGTEYDHAVHELGDRRRAESELARRAARLRKLNIQPLSTADRQTFAAEWRLCQVRFIDDPARAVQQADRLVSDILYARGCPVDGPDEQMEAVSAAYPAQADDYRRARAVAAGFGRGQASTDELRETLPLYKTLFDALLSGQEEELQRAS